MGKFFGYAIILGVLLVVVWSAAAAIGTVWGEITIARQNGLQQSPQVEMVQPRGTPDGSPGQDLTYSQVNGNNAKANKANKQGDATYLTSVAGMISTVSDLANKFFCWGVVFLIIVLIGLGMVKGAMNGQYD